jgi:hypothetical protein
LLFRLLGIGFVRLRPIGLPLNFFAIIGASFAWWGVLLIARRGNGALQTLLFAHERRRSICSSTTVS